MPDDRISQSHLATAWKQTGDQPSEIAQAWLDGGPTTVVRELREASPGITVLMSEDVPRVKLKPKALSRLMLPMPPCGGWNSGRANEDFQSLRQARSIMTP